MKNKKRKEYKKQRWTVGNITILLFQGRMNNQYIYDRNKRYSKSSWSSKNKKEYHSRKTIKTNASVVNVQVLNDSIMYSELQLFIIMCYILLACKIKMHL